MDIKKRDLHEIEHFSKLPHVWWGLKTIAGQKRYDNKLDNLVKYCNIQNKSKILEVGCGNGEFTKRLAKIKSKDIKIAAIDLTPDLITLARKTVKNSNVIFKIDNLHKLSFNNNEFNLVCGISILHHVDLGKSLSEIYRVLKPGGEIFFTEPNMLNPVIFLGIHIPILKEKMEFSPDETAFKRWFLEKELKNVGFKYVSVSNYDFLHPNTPKSIITIIEKASSVAEKTPLLKEISGSLIIYAKK